MKNDLRMELLDEVIEHLHTLQADDLRSILDDVKSKENEEKMGSEKDPMMEGEMSEGKPKGLAIEHVEVIPKEKDEDDEDDMDEDEIEEMLRHL